VEHLLGTLHPSIAWRAGDMLFAGGKPESWASAPQGRGLRLLPSHFAPKPLTVDVPGAPVTLIYPAHREPPRPHPNGAVAALLGRTRAAGLANLTTGCTTTQLACRLGISLASASQHASVLRDAGLVVTRRTGSAVEHTLTPLGSQLLRHSSG
jgi:DNA-binding transcriptional ArsR family regulator